MIKGKSDHIKDHIFETDFSNIYMIKRKMF